MSKGSSNDLLQKDINFTKLIKKDLAKAMNYSGEI